MEIQPFDYIKKILLQFTSRNPSLSAFRISYSPGRTESLLMGKLSSITLLAISTISTISQHPLLGYRFIYCVFAPGDFFRRQQIGIFATSHQRQIIRPSQCIKSAGEAISSRLHGYRGKTLQGGNSHQNRKLLKLIRDSKFSIICTDVYNLISC